MELVKSTERINCSGNPGYLFCLYVWTCGAPNFDDKRWVESIRSGCLDCAVFQ